MICSIRTIMIRNCFKNLNKNHISSRKLLCHRKWFSHHYSTTTDGALSLKTYYCGSIFKADVNKTVTIRGFLQFKRQHLFFILRDIKGTVQVKTLNEEDGVRFDKIPMESYVEVVGTVSMRPERDVNKKMSTGEIEIFAEKFEVLSKVTHERLPFPLHIHNEKQKRSLLERYRYLQLRTSDLKYNLILRSLVSKKMRDYLFSQDFFEITTPTLSFPSPGGAAEFNVFSDNGLTYSLAQSPQIYKQLLMIGGLDKYYQFAVCFRNEGTQNDRQPEFMQLDLEMADTTINGVIDVMEKIILHSWPEEHPKIPSQFPRMKYADAMNYYGSDKPDTRFEWKFTDVSDEVALSGISVWENSLKKESSCAKAFLVPKHNHALKKSAIIKWEDISKENIKYAGLSVLLVEDDLKLKTKLSKFLKDEFVYKIIAKLGAQTGDAIILSVGCLDAVNQTLGKLRIRIAEYLENHSIVVRKKNSYKFLWITDFPLFEVEHDQLISCHHPFTAPVPADIDLLYSKPEKVRSQHYDLVLNGSEIAGGSIRIHDSKVQEYILNDILQFDISLFKFFLDAFKYGAPPHGGIALGFDRYLSCITNSESVRDVMAFPKSGSGTCLLTKVRENEDEA